MLNTKEEIANEVIKLSKLNIFDRTRKRKYVENRALLSYILYKYKNMRVTDIARFFRENNTLINHDTIIYYNKNFESYAKFNYKLSERLDTIIMKIDKTDYTLRRNFVKNKVDVLSDQGVDSVLSLVKNIHNKELKQKIKRYEEQIQELVEKGIA